MENEVEVRCKTQRSTSNKWTFFNNKLPKSEVIYFSQVILIYIVSIACVVNLSIAQGNLHIWSNILCACIGYMIPAPRIKKLKNNNNHESIFSDTSE